MGFGADHAWMSQAWSVFHALGMTLEDNLGDFQLRLAQVSLFGPLSRSRAQWKRRLRKPIYIFVRPLPSSPPLYEGNCKTSSMHHWSFREDGDSPLSPQLCRFFGLPTTLRLYCHLSGSRSWPHDNYKYIHKYQRLRGFDPTTTDFARHVKNDDINIVFQPVNDSIRFKRLTEEQITGSPELDVDSDPEDEVYDSDDYSLAALFYTGSDDDTYTNSAHISTIQERKALQEDTLPGSDARAEDVPAIKGILANTDHTQRKTGAGVGLKNILEGHDDPNQTLEQCYAALPAPNAKNPSLPSISGVDLSSGDRSFSVVPLTPSFPAHSTALAMPHPETHEDYGAGFSSAHTALNISPVRRNNGTTSLSDTLHSIGLSTMPQPATRLAVSDFPDSTIEPPVHSTSTVESTDGDALLTHNHNGGPSASVSQQRWVPRSFVPRIRSWRVPTTLFSVGQPESPIGNTVNHGENEDLD
ncbi:hypothetical protein PQX77_018941 [Marasmius sp. AFHP31]|nr:hypothetical protein PQX77_018941 [Marasmius sp. AFHP31]